jgi:hypothetical protein
MVPATWVELQSLPLTPNGKIDKKALLDLDVADFTHDRYMAPQTEVEEKLCGMWRELLHLEQIGIHDSFFELGGHSLIAKRMTSCIERAWQVSVPIQVLFQMTTISELAKYLEIQLNRYPKEKNGTGYKLVNI